MDFAIKYLSDPVCPAFGPVRSRVCPFSYMLYILLQKDFYYSVFSGICQELILHILQISAFNSSGESHTDGGLIGLSNEDTHLSPFL